MSRHRIATSLAVLTAVSLTAAAAHAAPNLSGWGTRDWTTFHSTFIGDVTLNPDGTLTGHFSITTANDGEDLVFCRYLRFSPTRITGTGWVFDGYGVCLSASSGGYYAVSNRFAIADYGTPGVGVDYIDVNYYGPVGPSIPGGYLQSGDLVHTP